MKIRILDRILVALAGILVLAGCAALAAQLFFQKDIVSLAGNVLQNEKYRVWLIVILVLLVILGCYCLLILFRHRGKSDKFVQQKTENGELCISLKAMESMVQKCLDPHKELSIQNVRLENQKGGLLIRIRGTVAGNVSIPLTVDALQQQIKQYVTACSGVEVKDIRVMIESSGPDTPDSLFAIEPPTARALPGGEKAEKPAEAEKEEIPGLSTEELEQVMAEMPAPHPAEAEETEGKAEVVTVSAAAAAAAEMLRNEAPPEEDDRPIHQRLFSNPEEPCVMPMPPEKTEAEPAAEAASDENSEPAAKEPETNEEAKSDPVTEETEPEKEETENGTSEGSKEA